MFWTKRYFQAKSLLVLFSILLSFSLNAYNSFSLLKSKHASHSFKLISIEETSNVPVNTSNLFFEEEENETENEETFSKTEAFIICFVAGWNSFRTEKNALPATALSPVPAQPLFLSIRVLRL